MKNGKIRWVPDDAVRERMTGMCGAAAIPQVFTGGTADEAGQHVLFDSPPLQLSIKGRPDLAKAWAQALGKDTPKT